MHTATWHIPSLTPLQQCAADTLIPAKTHENPPTDVLLCRDYIELLLLPLFFCYKSLCRYGTRFGIYAIFVSARHFMSAVEAVEVVDSRLKLGSYTRLLLAFAAPLRNASAPLFRRFPRLLSRRAAAPAGAACPFCPCYFPLSLEAPKQVLPKIPAPAHHSCRLPSHHDCSFAVVKLT
jgi:hypothetical protein